MDSIGFNFTAEIVMKLLNKQGQTTHKFSFLTAEQKPWQTLSDFM